VGSSRAGVGASGEPTVDQGLLASAASLRWARPDLTAALADHVMETASDSGDRDTWLVAAGWAVYARTTTSDPREVASEILESVGRWGGDALAGSAAARLRVELGMAAAGAGEAEIARELVAGVDAVDPVLHADLLSVRARCAVDDAPDEVRDALRAAEQAWSLVPGRGGQMGVASVALIDAVVQRRARRPGVAVDRASAGLARLQRTRGTGTSSPSAHLAAALAAEWISALLDADRLDEAREGCAALMPRLSEPSRPTRQLALLRLTVARAAALGESTVAAADLLERAAADAAASDVPDLEAVCRSALAALREKAGQLDGTVEELQRGVAAERRDRSRIRRFRTALAGVTGEPAQTAGRAERGAPEASSTQQAATGAPADPPTVPGWADVPRVSSGEGPGQPGGRRHRADRPESVAGSTADAVASEASAAEHTRGTRRDEEAPPDWAAIPWAGSTGESPIGDLLLQNMRSGDGAVKGRNGRSRRPDADDMASDRGGAKARPGDGPGRSSRPAAADDVSQERGRQRSGAETGRGQEHRPGGRPAAERSGDDAAGRGADAARGASRSGSARDDAEGRSGAGRPRRSATLDELIEEVKRRAAGQDAGSGAAGRDPEGGGSTGRNEGRVGGSSTERTRSQGADPWSTGRWPAWPTEREIEPTPDESSDVYRPRPDADTDTWLRAALAELDRAARVPASQAKGVTDERCTVVIDVARDARRFAGRRARAVVRAVADRLTDRLPAGARLRLEETDAVTISRPGWERSDATRWLHETLPGLLEGLVVNDRLPAAQLRAAVHNAGGPVGAQILQSLEGVPSRNDEGLFTPVSELTSPREGGTSRQRPEGRTEKDERARAEGDPRGWPWAGDQPGMASDEPGGRSTPEGRSRAGARSESAEPTHGSSRPRDERSTGTRDAAAGRHEAEDGRSAYLAGGADDASGHRHRRDERDAWSDGPDHGITGDRSHERTRHHGVDGPRERDRVTGASGEGAGRAERIDGLAGGGDARREPDKAGDGGSVDPSGGDRPGGHGAAAARGTDGLGIADLLAGALAAYRGI
jgi:hypothetical protein